MKAAKITSQKNICSITAMAIHLRYCTSRYIVQMQLNQSKVSFPMHVYKELLDILKSEGRFPSTLQGDGGGGELLPFLQVLGLRSHQVLYFHIT